MDDLITANNVIHEDRSRVGELSDATLDAIETLVKGYDAPEFAPVNIDLRTTNRRTGDVRNVAFFIKLAPDIVSRLVAELRIERERTRSKRRLRQS